MAILRTDIERALDEFASQEEGMRFQLLAVLIGKDRWPQLIAHQRKKDHGLDAYADANETPDKIGKGLAASITPTLKKVSDDAKMAKQNFPELKSLLFVTPAKVGNADRRKWQETIRNDYGLTLQIIEREEIIAFVLMPRNAAILASFFHLNADATPQLAELIERTRRAASVVARAWATKYNDQPLIDLSAEIIKSNGEVSDDAMSLDQIDQALTQSGRIVLEGPAGRGKTTTLVQLALRARTAGTFFLLDLPSWISSRRGILDYIAGMNAFQVESITSAELARVQHAEPFVFLLNGWNEIAASNSEHGTVALRELEREFPNAGIIVATRTHHLTPPLPGALRLRLLRLQATQRTSYLSARFGDESVGLCTRIEADASLDQLTRTPFVLAEVAALFAAGVEIPSTKLGILGEVLRLQEQLIEHTNALKAAPIFDRHADYLNALATEMTRRGAAALPDIDARAVVAVVARELAQSGQIGPVTAPDILATLTAHHILERVDYPRTTFQFEHQQFQEYFAALSVRAKLFHLPDEDRDAIERFTADYVNDPTWAEPLRMIAATIAKKSDDGEADDRKTRAGGVLVEMAVAVDSVFAGELLHLCGEAVWKQVGAAVGKRLRRIYASRDGSFRLVAAAAMLATGANDFSDIIAPIFAGQDDHTRSRMYGLWPDIQVSSLGKNWREKVRGWTESARVSFVSELLFLRVDDEIVALAADDPSSAVKKAAVNALMWWRINEATARVLETMDSQTFDFVASRVPERMPAKFRNRTVAALRKFIQSDGSHYERLESALGLIRLGETDIDEVVKQLIASVPTDKSHEPDYIRQALEYLHKSEPAWVSEWVAVKVAEGVLSERGGWLSLATEIPDDVIERYQQRLEAENLKDSPFDGMIAVIVRRADSKRATRVFEKLRALRRRIDADPERMHDDEWQKVRQLKELFRRMPDPAAAAGTLAVASDDPLDIELVATIFGRILESDALPLEVGDDDLKSRLRGYLKRGVGVVLRQDDFTGWDKAQLAVAIARVGNAEDMVDLLTLVRADIERVHRGRAARARGDRGPLSEGATMSWAHVHITALIQVDSVGADKAIVDLIKEPEYRRLAAETIVRLLLPSRERLRAGVVQCDPIRATHEGRIAEVHNDRRRRLFADALNSEIGRLREQSNDPKSAHDLSILAKALAIVDGRSYAPVVLDVIAKPRRWNEYTLLEAANGLLTAGVVMPLASANALIDSFLERTEKWNWVQDSDRWLLGRILSLFPFVDDPVAGIARIREVLGKRRLHGHEFRGLITALGNGRADAVDLLFELATEKGIFESCEEEILLAFGACDSHRSHQVLLGFVDPDVQDFQLKHALRREDILIRQLTDLAGRTPEIADRLRELCELNISEFGRLVLSKVMERIGTPDALAASLQLVDDANSVPVPKGIWDQLESSFVEQRPYGKDPNVFTTHARTSNELRVRLFKMATEDEKRRRSAVRLLGAIEEMRLEHGRPDGEPRHPDFASGHSWPPSVTNPES